ncbi:hypothetical protein C8F04DRAFT_601211 [Mycena alexandri]|uniref:MYND-type domain-containing protein n=1 Tax=Mycena alexandri TaxID=1745969 RepID=A0AAD6SYF6_9AGAR|nr:hypothetical protein C8F04DRAFT_601211 [Mycena alexandri]
MARQTFLPLPQDAIRDPERWNSAWEVLLRGELAFPAGPPRAFKTKLDQIETMPRGVDETLLGYQALVASTCAVQRNITEEALKHFSFDDFEAKWMNAGADVRGKHILNAMADVCSKARNLNEARMYCAPELRLLRFRLDGKVFLNLLKSVMHADASFIPSQPIYVSHPGWDMWAAGQRNLNSSEAMKAAHAEILILRTKLICHVVQFTMRSFFGEDPPVLFVQKEHRSSKKAKNPMRSQQLADLVETFGPDGAKIRAADEKAGIKARISQRVAHCSYLGCSNTEEDDSVKFSRCKTCFEKLQRQVMYCSRACQTADWKLRHKAVCGKPIDFDTASQVFEHPISAQGSQSRIGPPVDGYKRSLALALQVTELNQHPTVDYHLYDGDGKLLRFDFGAGSYPQMVFRVRREMAMTTGHRGCIGLMAHFLCSMFLSMKPEKRRGITSNMIVAQFAREFAIDVRGLVLAAQQLQDADPLHRPPLLSEASPELWGTIVQAVGLSDIVVTLD